MIIIVMASVAGQFGLATYLAFGAGALACYCLILLLLAGFVCYGVRSLEEVEVFKRRFNAAFVECAKGIEPGSDRLGPKPRSKPNLMQEGNHDISYYIEEAKRLYIPFQRDVLAVLAKAADPTGGVVTVLSNLKGREVRDTLNAAGKHASRSRQYPFTYDAPRPIATARK